MQSGHGCTQFLRAGLCRDLKLLINASMKSIQSHGSTILLKNISTFHFNDIYFLLLIHRDNFFCTD